MRDFRDATIMARTWRGSLSTKAVWIVGRLSESRSPAVRLLAGQNMSRQADLAFIAGGAAEH